MRSGHKRMNNREYNNLIRNRQNMPLKDLIKLEIIEFKKDDQDTRVKHLFLNERGKKIFNEIFEIQKKRIYNALLKSSSEEVINCLLYTSPSPRDS